MKATQTTDRQDSTSPNGDPPRILMTAQETAHLLGISVRSIWRLSGNGQLPKPISLGRSKRWSRTAMEEYIAEMSQPASQKGM